MDGYRKTFNLRQLFACVTCFAIAAGVYSLETIMNQPARPESSFSILLFFVGIPLRFAAIGGGIGVLIRRFWIGIGLGTAIGIARIFMLWSQIRC